MKTKEQGDWKSPEVPSNSRETHEVFFDEAVFRLAIHLGFQEKSVLGDFATPEDLLRDYEARFRCDRANATVLYRQLLANEYEEFFIGVFGPRR